MRPLVIWDGDDTLWFVEQLYDSARSAVAAFVEELGLDAVAWEQAQVAIDAKNVSSMGLSSERFPTSCVQALDQVASRTGSVVSDETRDVVRSMAAAVFHEFAPLAEGAADALAAVREVARMALVTKGDPTVQAKRILDSGLGRYFDFVLIVPAKTASTFAAVAELAGVHVSECWSVGNSLPSDVNAALEVGMGAVWIDARVWSHERRETEPLPGRFHTADSLKEAVVILLDESTSGP